MHERIRYVNEWEIWIRNTAQESMYISIDAGDISVQAGLYGTEAAAALREAIVCWEHTHSFEALQDTSDAPYPGKRMRHADGQVIIANHPFGMESWCVSQERYATRFGCQASDLRPLKPAEPPQPRYRQYENTREALSLLTQTIIENDTGSKWSVSSISVDGVYLANFKVQRTFKSFESVFREYTIDGHPVGVKVEDTNNG